LEFRIRRFVTYADASGLVLARFDGQLIAALLVRTRDRARKTVSRSTRTATPSLADGPTLQAGAGTGIHLGAVGSSTWVPSALRPRSYVCRGAGAMLALLFVPQIMRRLSRPTVWVFHRRL
jgi:hypothetical protein